MKLLAAILALLTISVSAEDVPLEWHYDSTPTNVAWVEIDIAPQRTEAWTPAGLAMAPDEWVNLPGVPDGKWHARARSVTVSGTPSPWSNLCWFAVPVVPPPTHVRIDVFDRAGRKVNSMTDPINGRAFYRMAPSGPPHVQRSRDMITWEQFGEGCPPGEYRIELTAITISPTPQ